MKLSIIITFWDNDQDNIQNLLNQIEERVKVEHEVIIIDNRTDTSTQLSFTPTYSFGFNAHQFMARKKALEFATGEFIWFIDGDDEIIGLDEISDHDIQVYRYKDNYRTVQFDEEEIKDFYNTETFIGSYVPVWNKIFRKSLFDGFNFEADIINSEDTIYNLYAIRNAKSYKRFNKIIYHQNTGNSNCKSVSDVNVINNIFYGYSDAIKIIKELCDVIDFEKIQESIFEYFMLFIGKSETKEVVKTLFEYLFKYFDADKIHDYFMENCYGAGFIGDSLQIILEYLETNYSQYEWQKYYECKVTKIDGTTVVERRKWFDF